MSACNKRQGGASHPPASPHPQPQRGIPAEADGSVTMRGDETKPTFGLDPAGLFVGSGRRGLLALAGSAAASAGFLCSTPPARAATIFNERRNDEDLLALCARLEALQRRVNSMWLQGVQPRYFAPASYIDDDDERENAAAPLEAQVDCLFDQIIDRTPTTMEGVRAIVRCIVLAECDLRRHPDLVEDQMGLTDLGDFFVRKLLYNLAGGITERNCMIEPAVLKPREVLS